MTQKKQKNIKATPILLAIGILLIITGIIIIITSVKEYRVAYDIWHDKWWNEHTADLNDKPDFPFTCILGAIMCFAGLPITAIGLGPLISKLGAKVSKEIDEHASSILTTQTNTESVKKNQKCQYCGAKLPANSEECSHCGAVNPERK